MNRLDKQKAEQADFDLLKAQVKNLTANPGSATEGNAELLDIRVGADGTVYPTAGDAVRHYEDYFENQKKLVLDIVCAGKAETGTNSSSYSEGQQFMVGGHCIAYDTQIHMIDNKSLIRGYIGFKPEKFDISSGKKLIIQIGVDRELDLMISVGKSGTITDSGWNYNRMYHLYAGSNQIVIDTSLDIYKNLKDPDGWSGYFYVNWSFQFYSYVAAASANAKVGETYKLSISAYVPESDMAKFTHAANAANAAVQNIISGLSSSSLSLQYSEYTYRVSLKLRNTIKVASDAGFSVRLMNRQALKGRKIFILMQEHEGYHLSRIALNAGNKWAGGTYLDINSKLTKITDYIYMFDFDEVFNSMFTSIIKDTTPDKYDGLIYLMIYSTAGWDVDSIINEDNLVNYYACNMDDPTALIYDPSKDAKIKELTNKVSELTTSNETLIESNKTLTKSCEDLQKAQSTIVTDANASNVLYGKKYVACGDSFTQGDFSGWTDENGLSGHNSPVIYDSAMKYYKTYPWWIAKRNNMTLINEALCGSIMALDKSYVANKDTISESTRSPFSLKRYKAIPEDADYITIWFGINDTSHTNLGTIDDTTNETFYGAWNVVLEWLITNRPYAKIGIIITNGAGSDYREAERKVAEKWGIPYLDMMGNKQVPVIFGRESSLGLSSKANSLRSASFRVTPSNGHPNIQAHEYQSTFIENFLRSL